MNQSGLLARVVRAIVNEVITRHDSVETKLDTIANNHLAHIQAEINDLSGRLGRVEGKLGIILGMGALIFGAVAGPLIAGVLK